MIAGELVIFAGAALPLFWGIAHLFPTKSVVDNFGDIGADNRNIIAMEWVVEGVALIFLGFLVALVTWIDARSPVAEAVYVASAVCLVSLAVISLFTGFRIAFLPFKLCPVIFSVAATMIVIGWAIIKWGGT